MILEGYRFVRKEFSCGEKKKKLNGDVNLRKKEFLHREKGPRKYKKNVAKSCKSGKKEIFL